MKKFMLGICAVLLAIGFSAFTAPKEVKGKNLNEVYWFYVESGAGDDGSYTNATVTFASYSENPPSMGCSGSGNRCIVKFNPADLHIITAGVEAELDDNNGANAKTPLPGGTERTNP